MLLIIDNQSSFIKKFKRNFLSEQNIEYRFFDHNEPLVIKPEETVEGIILSGGKGSPYEPLNLTTDFVALMNYNVPILGICLGFEIIAVAYLGRIKKMEKYQQKLQKVTITQPEDPIFKGLLSNEILLREQHIYKVTQMPNNFITLGESETCDIEIFRHKDKPVYGFQSHPEVSGVNGMLIIRNFLIMCGFEVI
jgi:GMP synthase (glutamine-hydrolysing)